MLFLEFLSLGCSEVMKLTVKPQLTNQNVNSFFQQMIELQIPSDYRVFDIRFQPIFANKYRPFFVVPESTTASENSFQKETKSFIFDNFASGTHTFRIKSDWEYEDEIELHISYESHKSTDTFETFRETPIFVIPIHYAIISLLILLFIPKFQYIEFKIVIFFICIFSISFNGHCFRMMLKMDNRANSLFAACYPLEKPDDWATYDEQALLEALNSKLDYSKCRLCNITAAKKSKYGSTERDAIFAFTYGRPSDFLGLISARTVGFKGKMFIFHERQIPQRLKDCGIYHIPITVTRTSEHYLSGIRFPVIYQLLEKHGKEFDRVIYADADDVFFQSDPFDFVDDALQVSDEHFPLIKEWCSIGWFGKFPGFSLDYFDPNTHVTCAGIFGGYVDVVYKMTRLVAGFWGKKEPGLMDQSIYDFIIESNISKKAGIKVKDNPDLETRGIELRDPKFDKDWPVNPLGKFHNARTGFYAAAIHQTNRKVALHNLFREQCQ